MDRASMRDNEARSPAVFGISDRLVPRGEHRSAMVGRMAGTALSSGRGYRPAVPKPPSPAVSVAALAGVVGPAAFIAAWGILGAGASNYSAVHDPISRLAASGAPTRAAMTAGLLALGTGLIPFAIALRDEVPGPAWAFAAGTGVSALGVAAAPLGSPLSDDIHGVVATLGYATLAATPIAASVAMGGQDRRHWARISMAAGTVCGLCLLATIAVPARGLFQRVGLTAGHLWIMVTGARVIGRRFS